MLRFEYFWFGLKWRHDSTVVVQMLVAILTPKSLIVACILGSCSFLYTKRTMYYFQFFTLVKMIFYLWMCAIWVQRCSWCIEIIPGKIIKFYPVNDPFNFARSRIYFVRPAVDPSREISSSETKWKFRFWDPIEFLGPPEALRFEFSFDRWERKAV